MKLTKRINVIKEKLEELKRLDKGFSIFGSDRHKYWLAPTLKEEDISEIESDNGIIISKEYREILKHIGNGGAGCGYGLESLTLKNINPPYIGTKELLRNWEDPKKIDHDMVELDEISGYIKLFDHGCGMETCLIVNGEEQEELIFFDCDGKFEKIENRTLLDINEDWLNESSSVLRRVEKKLNEIPLQDVIDSEWVLKNYTIKGMILSLIDAKPLKGSHSGNEKKEHLEKEHKKWKKRNEMKSRVKLVENFDGSLLNAATHKYLGLTEPLQNPKTALMLNLSIN